MTLLDRSNGWLEIPHFSFSKWKCIFKWSMFICFLFFSVLFGGDRQCVIFFRNSH